MYFTSTPQVLILSVLHGFNVVLIFNAVWYEPDVPRERPKRKFGDLFDLLLVRSPYLCQRFSALSRLDTPALVFFLFSTYLRGEEFVCRFLQAAQDTDAGYQRDQRHQKK